MAVISITDFGGEVPRESPRSLPDAAAQQNVNLLATSRDFNPVLGHTVVNGIYGVPMNTKTLYRTQNNFATGEPWEDLSQGWVYTDKEVNIVRGQVLDDTTERHFYTQADGSMAPRTNNNKGEDYILGLPRPPKPELTLLTTKRITTEKIAEWRKSTLIPAVLDAVRTSISVDQFAARFSVSAYDPTNGAWAGASVAGISKLIEPGFANHFEYFPKKSAASELSQRGQREPWNMLLGVPNYLVQPEGIGNPQLGGIVAGEKTWIAVSALPLWGVLDVELLRTKLTAIRSLNNPTKPLWMAHQVQFLLQEFAALLSADYYEEWKSKRSELDAAYLDFVKAGERLIANSSRPVKTGAEDQIAFDARMASWMGIQSSAVTAMVTAAARAGSLAHDIEAGFIALYDGLPDTLATYLTNLSLEKTDSNLDGLATIDSDVSDTRSYVTTYVNDWGDESAPSEPSAPIDLYMHDLVVVNQPSKADVQADRNITKWRLYRTNAGTNDAEFRFVAEIAYTDVVPAPYFGWGKVGVEVAGLGDKDKWRDAIATWVVYTNDRGESASAPVDTFRDTSKLRIGDTVIQHNSNTNGVDPSWPAGFYPAQTPYAVTKTWDGGAWVLSEVPDISRFVGQPVYIDGKYSSALGEVLPTTTWLPPPYKSEDTSVRLPVAKGNSPYMRGLTAMANGVMVGFIDNYLTPSEPYVGYAYPVEYQIPIKYPIVGIKAMGQSAIVGTKGAPYIVSGADSASLTVQELNLFQPCASARSMVAAMGGVFFASFDGYCFADNTGVVVATAGLFSKEDWLKLDPSSIFAVVSDNVLYFWYTGNGGGCFGMDMVARKLTRHSIPATAAFADPVTDAVYVTYGGEIRQLFGGFRKQGVWKSKKITLPRQQPMAWVRALSDFDAGPVVVNWYGDGVLRHSATLHDRNPQRLPSGRYLELEIEVISQSRVSTVTVASTTEELKAI